MREVFYMEQTIYLFYGPDSYIIKQKTLKLIDMFHIDPFNIVNYDMEESPIEEAVNDATTIPFMADKKMVVIKNAYFLSNETQKQKKIIHDLDYLQRYVDNPVKETILVIQVPYAKLDKRKAITKALVKTADVQECIPLKEQDLKGWTKRFLAKYGLAIDTDALDELIKRISNNTEVLVSETTKLALYAEGMNKVDLNMIRKVITRNVEDNVYEIVNNILDKKRSKALTIYNDLIMHSEDPLRILNIISSKYRELLHTKLLLEMGKDKTDIATYFNASSGRAYYIMKNARNVSSDVVKEQLEKLELLDYQIKSGKIDKKVGIELFILGT
jgi:DNA polymerase-3 subunit delta